MKNTALKLIFWMNYVFVILYISWHRKEQQTGIESILPLFLSSLMLIDVTYISSRNIRENKAISLFCGLLALDSWYLLLSRKEGMAESFIFIALSPIIWYASIRFILLFLFQGSGYKFRKPIHAIMLIACIGALAGISSPGRVFALLYGIQFCISWLCFLFIVLYHRKRIAFVIKSERKCISFSIVIIAAAFVVYYFATANIQNHISNFGTYLPMLLFFLSVHGIVLKEHNTDPLSTVFSKKQSAFILCLSLVTLGLIILLTGSGYEELFLAVNVFFSFIYICNIVLELSLKQGKSRRIKESDYHSALRQLQQEELLKTEFANFLHDDVLQDLLSMKNMMAKAYRPEIQDILMETLEHLNTHIREQMQDYHPVILRNLTARENYQNLMEAVSQSFPQRNIAVSFDCSDALFLVEPYHVLVYRLLKELLTNVYKHSKGNRAWVRLSQEHSTIELCVSDNGTASPDSLLAIDQSKHKGIASIAEQVNNMDGRMAISSHPPHGICIKITLPMKGDVSYQYFVSG
ncbi:MAG: ATP-binding protein [Eubacterium sp.]|nr:ATP-binding protein [Eubacterium sp.]